MKKTLLLLPLIALSATLTSCREQKADYTVGILQIITHDALDKAQEGFKKALKEDKDLKDKKIKFLINNPEGDESSQNTMAKSLANKCDLLLGISTGSSIALKNARDEVGGTTPILFTAVTDPVNAELMPSMSKHNGRVTGTSDDNPVETQVDLIKRCFPNKAIGELKLGILYTSSEPNSEVQADRAEEEARKEGITNIKRTTCIDSTDLKSVASSLASQVDAIYIPTDNNIAAHMDSIKSATDTYHTLCIVGEEGMLKGGGHLTYSVSYPLLGKRTGEMAADILTERKAIEDIDAEKMLDEEYLSKVFNSKNINDSGLNIPSDVLEGFKDVN